MVIPRAPSTETLVEFSHRLSSGVAFALVVGLFVWAFRAYPKGHPVRVGATLSMVFMTTEALIGAGLVLFELVADNTSLARAFSISIHLVNTFLLLGSLTMTAWLAAEGAAHHRIHNRRTIWPISIGLIAMLFVGTSGALAALGDTLFPAASLAEGVRMDFSPTAHFLIRLRLLHPVLAVGTGLYLVIIARVLPDGIASQTAHLNARWLMVLVIIQLVAGAINIVLLAPIWLQMVHLLLADLVWITLVLFSAHLLLRKLPIGEIADDLIVSSSRVNPSEVSS